MTDCQRILIKIYTFVLSFLYFSWCLRVRSSEKVAFSLFNYISIRYILLKPFRRFGVKPSNMRKVLLLVFFYLIAFESFGQFDTAAVDTTTGRITFSRVVLMDSIPQKQLYTNARVWFSENFKSSNHVIQMDDKEAGIIIGKGFAQIVASIGLGDFLVDTYFTLKIEVKDKKYRFTLTDIYYHYPASYTGNVYSPAKDVYAEEMITPQYLFKKNGEMRPAKSYYYYNTIDKVNLIYNSVYKTMATSTNSKNDW